MWKFLLRASLLLAMCGPATGQGHGDTCHVYVIDSEKARKAWDAPGPTDEKAVAEAVTTFPEFRTVAGEEELTTKTYRFPRGRLFITASVFYTDEMMASSESADSVLLGILVAPKPRRDALSERGAAIAELTSRGADTARVKQFVTVGGRAYLVGLECRMKPRKE